MPLPKPNAGESRNEFVSRCMIDLTIRDEYGSLDQRIAVCNSLYENKQENKQFGQNWVKDYDRVLTRAERTSVKNFRNYYLSEYEKGANMYLEDRLNNQSINTLFKNDDLTKMYQKMYVDVGMKMFKWFKKEYEKDLKKQESFDTLYAEQFAKEGLAQAGTSVTLVSGTAKKSLENIIQKLTQDPVFQESGVNVQKRMFRKEFKRYSDYQAERLVRTESNYLSNYANEQSALSVYPQNQLKKQWITRIDNKERASHNAVNNDIKMMNEPFIVGGFRMMRPGHKVDGNAKEVINCRCVLAYIPIPNAQTIQEINDIGFGLTRELVSDDQLGIVQAIVNNTIREELVNRSVIKPNGWDEITNDFGEFDDSYLSMLSEKITITKFNGRSFASVDGKSISLNTSQYKYAEGKHKVLAHEVGHSIHLQRGWITPYSEIKGTTNKIVKDTFDKYLKKYGFRDKAKTQEISKKLNELGWFSRTENYKNIKEFADLTQEQYINYLTGYADTIEALTKGKAGWGHGKTYYSRFSGSYRYMEFFAHAMENTFVGNPVFKYYDIDLYNDMIKMIRELQKIPK